MGTRRQILAAFSLVLLSAPAPALAQPGELLRKLRQNLGARLFPDLSAEEKETLKAIKDEFLAEARPTLNALGIEARALMASIKEILTDEQESRTHELIAEARELPAPRKLALLRRLLKSLRGEDLARDAGLCLGGNGTADEKVQAADRIARRAAGAVTGHLASRGAIGGAEEKAISGALDGFLDRTRAQRSALGKLAGEKLQKAWDVMSLGQRSRLEMGKAFILGWLSGS